jgi:hypothetical protein
LVATINLAAFGVLLQSSLPDSIHCSSTIGVFVLAVNSVMLIFMDLYHIFIKPSGMMVGQQA